MRWAGSFGVESDPEEFLLNANLFLSFDMDRTRGAIWNSLRARSTMPTTTR